MNSKDSFLVSCNAASTYPRNIVSLNPYSHITDMYIERLKEEEQRLFCVESRSDVELWEYRELTKGMPLLLNHCRCDFRIGTGFVSTRINENIQLASHLTGEQLFEQVDPQCRFLYDSQIFGSGLEF